MQQEPVLDARRIKHEMNVVSCLIDCMGDIF
jgi:hypothetical protein